MEKHINPWDDIETPMQPAFATRVLDSSSSHKFMWIKDGLGRIGLALAFDKKIEWRFVVPVFQNLEIKVQPDKKTITFILHNNASIRQFRIFCKDCVETVKRHDPNDVPLALGNLEKVIVRWVGLFEEKSVKRLSKSVELGLIGEIIVMRDVLMEIISPSDSVFSWCGPKRHEQDFVFNSSLIEVKCQLASKDKAFTISSLEQLDGVSGQIYLLHLGISPTEENSDGSFTLLSLVNDILATVAGDNYAIDTLMGLLELGGFKPDENVNYNSYIESFLHVYKVTSDFPKITKTDVRPAIDRCKYRLNATMLGDWMITRSRLKKEILA